MLATAALCFLGHCMAAPPSRMSPALASDCNEQNGGPSPSTTSPTAASPTFDEGGFVPSPCPPRSGGARAIGKNGNGTPFEFALDERSSDHDHQQWNDVDSARTSASSMCRRLRRTVSSISGASSGVRRIDVVRGRQTTLRQRIHEWEKRLTRVEADHVREHVMKELNDQVALSPSPPPVGPPTTTERYSTRSQLDWMVQSSKGEANVAWRCLRNRWRRTQHRHDDEGTESSSGGEDSDLESSIGLDERKKPVRTRASAVRRQWDEDRASIGAHWQLLHSRISDLEYRIRKQSELCEKLEGETGKTSLAKSRAEKTCVHRTCINGSNMMLLRKQKEIAVTNVDHTEDDGSKEESRCARVLPLQLGRPRKRIIKGNVTLDDDGDDCDSQQMVLQPVGAQLSRLDFAFHPRLSLLTDLSLPLLLQASVRHDRWLSRGMKRKSRVSGGSDRKRSFLSSSASGAMLRYERANKSLSAPSTPQMRSNSLLGTRLCQSEMKRRATISEGDILSSSLPASGLASLKKRRSSAFDINAIVIPNSFFAATRVERIHYEEIVTPKWRSIADQFILAHPNGISDVEEEDLSEETFIARHTRAEVLEKKRYLSWTRKSNNHKTPSTLEAPPTTDIPGSTLISVADPLTPATPSPSLDEMASGRGCRSLYRQWRGSHGEQLSWPLREFPLPDASYKAMLAANESQNVADDTLLLSTRAKTYGGEGIHPLPPSPASPSPTTSSATKSKSKSSTGTASPLEKSDSPTMTICPTKTTKKEDVALKHWNSKESNGRATPTSGQDTSDDEGNRQWSVVSKAKDRQWVSVQGKSNSTMAPIVIKLTKR
eukprot:m.10840 g.10840  ORF g.10840 m.10840 type:complete len:829 (+) comp22726_c0_seq2:1074-3560(+)